MPLKKLTPTQIAIHQAISELNDIIKSANRTKATLSAVLPQQPIRKLKPEERFLVDPRTGEKGYF